MLYFVLYVIGGWITAYALLRKNNVNMNDEITGDEGSEVIVGALGAMFIWPIVLVMWAWHAYKERK